MFNRSLFSSATGEWSTPNDLFQELHREFQFTLDACATKENAKLTNFISERSLENPWTGTVWCNPPYGRKTKTFEGIGAWIEHGYKSAKFGATVVMLLPSRTDTRWWHDYVMKADEIRFIKGRLKFGGSKNGAPFPSTVVVFRP